MRPSVVLLSGHRSGYSEDVAGILGRSSECRPDPQLPASFFLCQPTTAVLFSHNTHDCTSAHKLRTLLIMLWSRLINTGLGHLERGNSPGCYLLSVYNASLTMTLRVVWCLDSCIYRPHFKYQPVSYRCRRDMMDNRRCPCVSTELKLPSTGWHSPSR